MKEKNCKYATALPSSTKQAGESIMEVRVEDETVWPTQKADGGAV